MAFKRVSVLGLGYVGLPLVLAIELSGKYETIPFDINKRRVNEIKDGVCPISDDYVENNLKKGILSATDQEQEMRGSDCFVICVPTPVQDDFTPDYGPILSASEIIGKYMKKGATVILESTVNPGTCEEVMIPVLEESSGLTAVKDFNVGMCPERINPGDPKWNIINIPRIVGSLVPGKVNELIEFYQSVLDSDVKGVSSLKVAEATKIVENTFRDVNIAFVNELAKSFDSLGIDLIETIQGASTKPFGFFPFWPGRGVGGHCIAVDPYYLIKRAAKSGFDHRFLKVARDVNNSMPFYTVGRLQSALNDVELSIKGTKIAVLGYSYKEDVADTRETPCRKIVDELKQLGADVRVYDPYVDSVCTHKTLHGALNNAQAVLLCTAHREFLELADELPRYPSIKVIVDGMNKLDMKKIVKQGYVYRGIGR